LPLRLRCFGTGTDRAISHGGHGSFGNRGQRVLGDVGVRFGGSEHHRIETSSSHTRPPPFGVGTPGHRDKAHGALRSTERQVPRHRVAQPLRRASGSVPTRGEAHDALRSIACRSSPRPDKRRSSEHRASNLTGTGIPALFGGAAPPFQSGQRAPLLDRGRAQTQRDTADGALRSTARRASSGQGTPRSSEHGHPRSTGTGQPAFFGAPASQFHWKGIPDLFGGTVPNPTGSGTPRLTGWAPAHRGSADGALRGAARCASTGQGKRRSSEHQAPRLEGAGNSSSSEPGPPTPREREPATPRGRGLLTRRAGSPRLTKPGKRRSSEHRASGLTGAGPPALLGARATRHRSGQSHGDTGRPAPRGRPARQATAGISGVRHAPRCVAVSKDTDLGRDPRWAGR
jgi:hypothetical protein